MRRSRRVTAVLLALMMLLGSGIPVQKVRAGEYTATEPKVSVSEIVNTYEGKPGETIEIKLPVKASQYTVRKPIISLDLEKDGKPFELVSDFVFSRDDTPVNTTITNLVIGKVTYITFSLRIKESARKGDYELGAMHFATTDSFNDYCSIDLIQPVPIKIKVTEEKALPELKIIKQTIPESVKPTEEFRIDLTFQNKGELPVKDVEIKLSGCEESGFIPKELYNSVKVEKMKAGDKVDTSFAFTASKTLTTGVKSLKAVVTFSLEDGTTETKETSFYIEAVASEQSTSVTNSDVQLVKTSYPKTVEPEESITVKLTYKNEGSAPVKDVKVQLGGYSEAGLLPDFIYDTVELKDLPAGASDTAAFSLTASKAFVAGTKALTAKVTYTTAEGGTYDNTVSLFLEGIVEEEQKSVTNSKPKLLIQDYDLGVEKLMAGSEFVFKFDVLNSHSTAKADNIKVTVSSADNTFSIIEGSSSFLISSIAAGEVQSCEIPLKVKGDAATGGYDLSITFDYEYAAKDENGNDVSKSDTLEEKLKIPVYSNDRPMVSNINVGYWELPRVGELTTMSFEFYNMGKSPLYNVTATVEGDFDAAGNMLMIGNVEPGSGKSWELDVTPMVEGYGNGVLHISYEDSNGNISTFDESFGSEIQSISSDPIIDDGSMGGEDMWNTDGTGVVEAKKPILPVWAFVLVQVVIFLLALPIARTIVIKRYKKKELKRLEDDLDD